MEFVRFIYKRVSQQTPPAFSSNSCIDFSSSQETGRKFYFSCFVYMLFFRILYLFCYIGHSAGKRYSSILSSNSFVQERVPSIMHTKGNVVVKKDWKWNCWLIFTFLQSDDVNETNEKDQESFRGILIGFEFEMTISTCRLAHNFSLSFCITNCLKYTYTYALSGIYLPVWL